MIKLEAESLVTLRALIGTEWCADCGQIRAQQAQYARLEGARKAEEQLAAIRAHVGQIQREDVVGRRFVVPTDWMLRLLDLVGVKR